MAKQLKHMTDLRDSLPEGSQDRDDLDESISAYKEMMRERIPLGVSLKLLAVIRDNARISSHGKALTAEAVNKELEAVKKTVELIKAFKASGMVPAGTDVLMTAAKKIIR